VGRLRIVPVVTLAACVVAHGSDALAREAGRPAPHVAVATSLQIAYSTPDFTLHYTLRCDPTSGTLARAAAACAAIAHDPIMVHGEPPQPPGMAVRSCPAPRETVEVAGTYNGAPAAADGADSCGGGKVLLDWQPYLPSAKTLHEVLPDRGVGPLRLGEPRAAVRALLGAPSKTISGADVYVKENRAIYAVTTSGKVAGFVHEMFAVGYGRPGTVTTIVANWLAAGPLSHPRRVVCAGRHSLASHALDARGATTIRWPSGGNSTVIVTSASTAACHIARATEQPVVNVL
jgi:hypothetical protein